MTPHEIPQSLINILKSCESKDREQHHFPITEVFNEGWMLRLVLDVLQTVDVPGHPLNFLYGATWYSEARLRPPFLRKPKKALPGGEKDSLGEGYTNADGVIGHFTFRKGTKAGLQLTKGEGPRQFIVVEAKMFSGLSSGTTNAPSYNQAARTIACMAEIIRQSGTSLDCLESVGFFVVAPKEKLQQSGKNSLRTYVAHDAIKNAIDQRMADYEAAFRSDKQLYEWKDGVDRLLERLNEENRLALLSWEAVIKPFRESDEKINRKIGNELLEFYKCCEEIGKSTR
jgi:hypothetical protein